MGTPWWPLSIARRPHHAYPFSFTIAWPDRNQHLPDQGAQFVLGLATRAASGEQVVGLRGYYKDHPCLYQTSTRPRKGFTKQRERSQSHKRLPTCRTRVTFLAGRCLAA